MRNILWIIKILTMYFIYLDVLITSTEAFLPLPSDNARCPQPVSYSVFLCIFSRLCFSFSMQFQMKINLYLIKAYHRHEQKLLLFRLAKVRSKLSQRWLLYSLSNHHHPPIHHPPPTTTGTFKALPGKLQSQFSVCNLTLTKHHSNAI